MIPTIKIKFVLLPILLLAANIGYAETCSPGDAFRRQATEYMAKAYILRNKGLDDTAQMYLRMSNIKKYVAALVDNGRWFVLDWESFYTQAQKIRDGGDVEEFIAELIPISHHFEETIAAR